MFCRCDIHEPDRNDVVVVVVGVENELTTRMLQKINDGADGDKKTNTSITKRTIDGIFLFIILILASDFNLDFTLFISIVVRDNVDVEVVVEFEGSVVIRMSISPS